jgi:hypothetical protein
MWRTCPIENNTQADGDARRHPDASVVSDCDARFDSECHYGVEHDNPAHLKAETDSTLNLLMIVECKANDRRRREIKWLCHAYDSICFWIIWEQSHMISENGGSYACRDVATCFAIQWEYRANHHFPDFWF